jgi:hypothetical protein
MTRNVAAYLLDASSWSFHEIGQSDPSRASDLETAASPEALVKAVSAAFRESISSQQTRYGRELAAGSDADYRAVIQFPVDAPLFDWFFNARTGYRAHFRRDIEHGLQFNEEIIETVRQHLTTMLSAEVEGRELDDSFEDRGGIQIRRDFLLSSFTPRLHKIWFCTKLIGRHGGTRQLPACVLGPKLLVDGESWAAFYPAHDDDAWLEIKGAFIGLNGPYQPKDPVVRAKSLQRRGDA